MVAEVGFSQEVSKEEKRETRNKKQETGGCLLSVVIFAFVQKKSTNCYKFLSTLDSCILRNLGAVNFGEKSHLVSICVNLGRRDVSSPQGAATLDRR